MPYSAGATVYDDTLLSEVFARYARDVIAFRNQSRKTEEHHNVAKKSLISFCGDIPLNELTFNVVREWKLSLEARRLSPITVRGYLVKLRVTLNYMRLKGLNCLDPSEIPLPVRRQTIPHILSPLEVQAFIDAVMKRQAGYPSIRRQRNATIISMLYSTGLRIEELVHLQIRDVEHNYFTVIGKGGRTRLCFIDTRTRMFLHNYLGMRKDNNPALFIGQKTGDRITANSIQDMFRFARKKAGFDWPVHPHTLRHSFATNLMKNGAHIYAISQLMGHSSLDTTKIYLHLYDAELKRVHKQYHTT